MCFKAVKYLPPRQSYWLYLIHPLSCLPPIYIDYSSMSWLRSKMAAALPQWWCYSLIAIWDFSLCGALGLLCLWQMLSYVHELSYKPMMCFSPSSPLRQIHAGNILRLGAGFRRVLRFLVPVTTGQLRLSRNMAYKGTKSEIQNATFWSKMQNDCNWKDSLLYSTSYLKKWTFILSNTYGESRKSQTTFESCTLMLFVKEKIYSSKR